MSTSVPHKVNVPPKAAVRPKHDHVDTRLQELGGDLPDLDVDVEGIVERIQGIDRRLQVVMEDTLDEHGLSYGEWKLLCKLRRAPEHTSTPGELSASLELSSGAMTNRIDGLERDGLVRRHPDPKDRRGVRVEMTDAGGQAWIESTNAQAIKEALIASALTKREQHQLNGLLRKLMLELEHGEFG
ncbi:MAG TPA: MarR family transcriptional regulator [Gaiellaceae bacterium]|jgi:DNA-binding MarR family transcriptional regulator|nr:MarR family transcriptional regulator [Gaiellaceae bacterium]